MIRVQEYKNLLRLKWLQNLELMVTGKQLKIKTQLIFDYMTIYFFLKNVVTFFWHLLEIWRSCRPLITFAIDSRSSALSNRENCMILSINYKASEADLTVSRSSISSSTSLWLDTSITLSAGLSCFWIISFQTPGNAAHIYCWHRGSNILVKIHIIMLVNVTSKLLHQISKFFIFILI